MDTSNLLRQLLMIGIGTTSLVAERVKQISEEWVRDGRINPDQAKGFVDDFMAQFNIDQKTLEDQMQRQIRNIMQDLGVPRQAEMDELRGRLDRLERQVRELENKLWK
jgi:polyhydroxyalkanoate synthesis regulator phasin